MEGHPNTAAVAFEGAGSGGGRSAASAAAVCRRRGIRPPLLPQSPRSRLDSGAVENPRCPVGRAGPPCIRHRQNTSPFSAATLLGFGAVTGAPATSNIRPTASPRSADSHRPAAQATPTRLAVGEIVILLHPPLPLVGVSIWTERGCQQNDSLADGYTRPHTPDAHRSRCHAKNRSRSTRSALRFRAQPAGDHLGYALTVGRSKCLQADLDSPQHGRRLRTCFDGPALSGGTEITWSALLSVEPQLD